MKRVGLSRFSPLEVSRRVLGVHTNGVTDEEGLSERRGSRECLSSCSAPAHPKSNLLSTIKKKLRKGVKRNKRCETRNRSDSSTCSACTGENPKHPRTRKPNGEGIGPWPVRPEETEAGSVGNLTQELYKLSKYGWYWGPINRSEAESKLLDQPDGAFLVRDSSDDRYILSLSFRSYGKTLHTRIEHSGGVFSFYSHPEPEGHASIVELIQQSMCYSQSGAFCYSRSRAPGSPSFPVRLTKAISRFTEVRTLQYLCRFVIRQFTRYDHIQRLPLPPRIRGYLEEGHY